MKFQIIGGNVVIRYFLLEFNVVAVFGALGKWGKMLQLLAYLFIVEGNRKGRGRKENPIEKRWGIACFLASIE